MHQLFFRADGNAQIGLGHIMRCLALADMLKSDFSMRFAVIEPAPEVISLIEKAGLSVCALSATDSQNDFLQQIHSTDVVVLDGYSFAESFQRDIRNRIKKLVFIDDLITGNQVADVVINHAGGISEQDYETQPYTQLYLGPHYALLRPDFLATEGFGPPPNDGPFVVSLGGADPQNISLTVLEGIQKVNANLPVHLILGPFHSNRPSIDAFRSQLPNLTILQNLSASQMVHELQRCRLAITSCSTISYEVCAVNRPLIGIVTADNQDRLGQFLSEDQLALSVNFPTLLTRLTPVLSLNQVLKLAIQSFIFSPEAVAETLANQRHFFDGRSPQRFRDLFQKLSA